MLNLYKVSGPSLYPILKNGDLVLVKRTKKIRSGDIAVIQAESNLAIVKKVEVSGDKIQIIKLNQDYDSKFEKNCFSRGALIGKVLFKFKKDTKIWRLLEIIRH